jgi:ATP-binding cassette subfamily B (MDR/TAP) protein 1
MWCGWVAGNSFFFSSHAASGKLSAKKVFAFLESNTEVEEQRIISSKSWAIPEKDIKGRIEFKNVSFKYPGSSRYVLKNLSFIVEAGQKAAFVGESGCGKSTVMLLLQRFYPFEGEITLDGRSIYDYDLATYRSYFAVLNQEPSLFTGSVRQNVVFGAEVSEEELLEACKLAHAFDATLAWKGTALDQCVKEFLDRDAGLKGSKVSGGEKQRLACARALLKKPRLFLMDEGTSALDPETEKRVQRNLDERLKGVTTVNIAHRFETIENSDVIFLFEEGRVVEQGTFRAMMERREHFYKFVQGERFKTINQIAEQMLTKLLVKLLGIKREL